MSFISSPHSLSLWNSIQLCCHYHAVHKHLNSRQSWQHPTVYWKCAKRFHIGPADLAYLSHRTSSEHWTLPTSFSCFLLMYYQKLLVSFSPSSGHSFLDYLTLNAIVPFRWFYSSLQWTCEWHHILVLKILKYKSLMSSLFLWFSLFFMCGNFSL